MSRTIDERVVSMQFDNKNFEANVQTSLSTLDKLKQKLNLSGASKGLENVSVAAKNVNMSGLGSAVESVRMKFSALEVMGVTALANITNSAVNAGKRIVSALTIDPIKTGLQEYETQINAVQTILANTQKEGTNVEIVNKALDELNEYADKTIYNFTEMTRNIGRFTAAGVKLDTSVNAIKGIANLAAVSGSTYQQASTAMYQLSQALAAGKVQLMDWNSVVNAGMGGQVFQDALIRTSENLKTGAKEAINTYGSFRESLTKSGWLTTEVLTETLNQLAGVYSKSELLAKGYSEAQADEIMKLAETAEAAATEVKTFTQLWDVMKEAAQSGWAQTWRLIIGDFEEAKALLTPLADFFTGENGIITKMSEARNAILESALGKGFSSLGDKINGLLKPAKAAADTVKDVTSTLTDLGDVVDEVILGKFGNGQERIDKLTESGQNYYRIQNKVNETLGNSFRYTEEQIAAQDKLLGTQKETSEVTSETANETAKLTEEQKNHIKNLAKMDEETLKSKGYTEEQIEALRELGRTAEQLGIPLDEFIDNLDEINGRWLLLNSFKNIGQSIAKVFSTIGQAWREAFHGDASDEEILEKRSEGLFNLIAAFHKFSASLKINDETADNLRRTFKGLFAVLDIVSTLVSGGLKIAFKILSTVLGAFDMNILDLTAGIGDALVKFRDFIFDNNSLTKAIDGLLQKLPSAISVIKDWFNAFKETPAVQKLVTAIEAISSAFDKLFSGKIDISKFARLLGTNLAMALKSIPEIALQIGKDFIAGFANGIGSRFSDVIDKIISFCRNFVSSFAEALGVQSPSWKAFNIAVDFFQGLINGIKSMVGGVLDVTKTIGDQIVKAFKSFWDFLTDESGNIEWDKIFSGGIIISMVWFLKQIATAFSGIADAFGGFGDLLESAGNVMNSFGKVLKGYAWDLKAKALQKLAISLGILVAAIWVLAQIDDPARLWNAVGVITVLAGVLIGLSVAMDKLSQASISVNKNGLNIEGLKSSLLQIGLAIALLAVTVKLIGSMDAEQAKQGFVGLAGVAVGMIAFMAALGGISRYSKDVGSFGGTMLKMSVAMLLMIFVIKRIAGLDPGDIVIGVAVMEAFILLFAQMAIVNRIAGANVTKFGGTLMKMSIAMMLMAAVIKMVSSMDPADVITGVAVMEAFVLLIARMAIANRIAGGNATKFGGAVLSMSVSMILLAGVLKILSTMDVGDVLKGVVVMEVFLLLISEMLLISKLGKDTAKVAGTILSMATAIGILAAVAALLSFIDLGGLAKGITAVGLLSLMMAGMVKALKGAQNVKGSIMMMAIAIGVMAAAVVSLSFIEPGKLAGATAALSVLMGMFAFMAKMSTSIKTSVGSMAIMLGVVVALGAVLTALSLLDVGSTIEIVTSIGILMVSLGATMKLISKTGTEAMKAMGPMAILTVIAGLIGLMLTGISKLNPGPTLEIAVALSAVLLAMSGAALILSKIGPAAGAGVASAAAFLGLVLAAGTILGVIGGLVSLIPGAQEFLDNGIPILQSIGQVLGSFIGGIVGGLIGGIGEGITDSLPPMIENLKTFLTGLEEASTTASQIKPDSFDGVGALVQALLGISVGSLVEHFASAITGESSMESFKTSALEFISAIGEISAGLSGVTIDNAAIESISQAGLMFTELNKSLPRTGGIVQDLAGEQDLAGFGEACRAFTNCMIAVNTSVSSDKFTVQTEKISALVAAGQQFSDLQNALPRTGGIVQDLAGEQDLAGFGEACRAFTNCMIAVSTSVSSDNFVVQMEKIAALVTAGQQFADLQNALPRTGGIVQDLAGEQDLTTFGASCTAFARCMVAVSNAVNVEGFNLNLEAIDTLKAAGEKFNELQNALPKSGGWWQEIAGESDLADFGGKIKAYGEALSAYSTAASGIDATSIGTSISIAYRMKSLIENLAGLDASGVNSFAGVGLGDGYLVNMGQAMARYGEEVASLDPAKVDTSVSAATRLRSLIANLAGLDTSGIEKFKVTQIGTAMKNYANEVSGIDASVVASSVTSANRLRSLVAGLVGLDTSGISKFKVSEIGSSLNAYSRSVAGFNSGSVSASITSANRLKTFITGLAGINTSGVSSFKTALSELSTVNIDGIVKAFSGASAKLATAGGEMLDSLIKGMKSRLSAVKSTTNNIISVIFNSIRSKYQAFEDAGLAIISKFAAGISKKKTAVISAVSTCISSAANTIQSFYSSFYSGGTYLGDGLVLGINAKQTAAYNAGYALGQAAVQGEKDGQKSNSPSKLTIQSGKWLGEGLIIGIKSLSSKVYNSGYKLGNTAAESIRSSVSKIADMVDSDIDTQPTIRPVLDLSDVRSGAGEISSMLGFGSSVGVLSNVGTINSMMNQRIQNGANDDVVSAINKLRKDLGNTRGDVYNFGDFTYDDGSNVSNAIKSLVRAAKIERRV